MPRTLVAIFGLLIVGGCAANSDWQLPDSHPANPDAASSPPATLSDTLLLGGTRDAAGEDGGTTGATAHAAHSAAAPATNPATQLYACPMHPEVVSKKSDDRCPKCRMFLKPAKGNVAAQPPATAPATPPGEQRRSGHTGHGGHH